jgi:hypothetical protein
MQTPMVTAPMMGMRARPDSDGDGVIDALESSTADADSDGVV